MLEVTTILIIIISNDKPGQSSLSELQNQGILLKLLAIALLSLDDPFSVASELQ